MSNKLTKEEKQEQRREDRSWDEMIRIAEDKGALVEEPGSPTAPGETMQPITVSSTPLLPPYKESQLFDPSTQ